MRYAPEPRSTTARAITVMITVIMLSLGLSAPAQARPQAAPAPAAVSASAPAAASLSTRTAISLSSARYSYGHSATVTATVRDSARHAPRGTIRFVLDGKALATVKLDILGRARVTLPARPAIGRHWVGARFVPTPGTGHAGSSAAAPFAVLRAAIGWGIKIPATPVYAGNASINVTLRGFTAVTGRVNLTYAGRTLQRQIVTRSGTVAFRVKADWPAGRAPLSVSYSGSATFAPAAKLVIVTTRKAASAVHLSVPSTLGFGHGAAATVSVVGAGATPTGRVTVSVDGQSRSSKTLSNGRVTLSVPALSGGRHTVTTTYQGDRNHSASSRSAVVTAASNQCPATARACVDLTHSETWLQSDGRITYGPVPMASGRPGYRTPAGTFRAYWKDIDHHSSQFNNAPMPYSVFFVGGVAFHEGSVLVESHGCIHLSRDAAVYYFNHLALGDRVSVFGYAPY